MGGLFEITLDPYKPSEGCLKSHFDLPSHPQDPPRDGPKSTSKAAPVFGGCRIDDDHGDAGEIAGESHDKKSESWQTEEKLRE